MPKVLTVLTESSDGSREDIFHKLVSEMAVSQGVRYALLALLNPTNTEIAETLAVWVDDHIEENFSFALSDSPCNSLYEHAAFFIIHNVQQQFSHAPQLADECLCVPLVSRSGEMLGLLALLNDKPIIEIASTRDLMNSFAIRATKEIERKRNDERLRLYSRIFYEAHEAITITDSSNTIIDVNPTFCAITGYRYEEVIGQKMSMLKSGKHPPEFYVTMWASLTDQGHWQGEIWNKKKNGDLFAQWITITALRNQSGKVTHYLGLFSDITQVKQQQQALELLAHYDTLTQLPNRVLLMDRFNQAIARAKRDNTLLAICYLDLDGFKQVNDTFGHEVGDLLLVEVGARIKDTLRAEDTISRLGGDEFVLLLGDILTQEQCEQTLIRVHQAIARPYILLEQKVEITASSGISIYPQDDADPDTLLRHADQAMYLAKQSGRSRYYFFDTMEDQEIHHHQCHLKTIERAFKRSEFCLYYQPKVDIHTGEVIGAEALIRWNHPERGILPPSEFLPIITGTPLENQIGHWVIQEALGQLDIWRKIGLNIQISVNIAPCHLQSPTFYSELDEALARYPAIESKQLELEVLESSAMDSLTTVKNVIENCFNLLGVPFALDDFGTGYSSLTHLRHLPVSSVKIDQSFVRDMLDDPDDFSIVTGVIGLANAFRRDVIAEGVETLLHVQMLRSMGCYLCQGYAIARPMPAYELPEWVRDWKLDPEWFMSNPKKAQLSMLQAELEQWLKRVEQSLQTDDFAGQKKPINNPRKSHLGRWITRARNDNRINQAKLEQLVQTYHLMYRTANQLWEMRCQTGQLSETRYGLSQLRSVCNTVAEILQAVAEGTDDQS